MSGQNSQSSQDLRTRFLIEFTKELVRNTDAYQSLIIKKEIKKFVLEKKEKEKVQEKEIDEIKNIQKKEVKEIVKEKTKRDTEHFIQLKKRSVEINPFKSFFAQRVNSQRTRPPMLQIPESMLPPTVQYLRPVPLPLEINLNELNPLIKDPFVRIIECNGPNENVMVIGTIGRKRTGITLSKEKIDEVIKTFSDAARIPINEGVSKVVFGKLILSAIVSNIIGSKFTIKKMAGPPVSHN